MSDTEEQKKDKVRKARLLFRQLAAKNQGWDGVKEIRKWRDRDTNNFKEKGQI